MKFPKKQIPIALAVLGMAVFASATALAKPAKPAELPGYMSSAANLGNAEYMACIKSKVKVPAAANILQNFDSTLSCQKPKT